MFHYVDRSTRTQEPYVLLLQGPVGPFFRDLQEELNAHGFRTKRVTFNAGDERFSAGQMTQPFSGSLDNWAQFFDAEMRQNLPDFVVMFGVMRPAHHIARQITATYGVRVICLEEGYLRSGYVTCEIGGNNDSSPLCQWAPGQDCAGDYPAPVTPPNAYLKMCFWAALYYMRRDFRATWYQQSLFHRKREGVFSLAYTWASHAVVRGIARHTSGPLLRRLRGKLRKNFVLVILQVPSDSQLLYAARGWSNEKLVQETLSAFRHTHTSETLVFKLHPLDRQARQTQRLIKRTARDLGIESQVHILKSGAIGDIAAHASGMIVINSTSAFSALRHNIPILAMGDAIYRHDAVVTVGNSPYDIWEFLNDRSVKPADNVAMFLRAVKATALLPGDFYCITGRHVAAAAIADKLKQELQQTSRPIPAAIRSGAA
ncbi:hypothetical protein DS901_17130 [Loktanella sp. D2R18]|uniref:capsular polysaccharide export protein, LipB/KpsS family n=1 Tax=Rhodobacterales TaxID=204455 RepID=UPI000DE87D26|nr:MULTISPECIES: hypothetical protein [Rhodobacterales]MDO6591196.1 hypothetical protein [Yoonia sp. 1_MG-2023]RBW41459.1 hypothetical protein DS901_17130 [Loktanella sp. D2R18]